MFLELVLREELRDLQHVPVSRDLREDGRGGDGHGPGVALDDGLDHGVHAGVPVPVHEGEVRFLPQPVERPVHGEEGGLQDVELVDLLLGGGGDAVVVCHFQDDVEERVSLFGGEFFRVVEAGDVRAGLQNDRRREHGTRQGASARFVDAADAEEPLGSPLVFELVSRCRCFLCHRCYPFGRSRVIFPSFPLRYSVRRVLAARSVSTSLPRSSMPRLRPMASRTS